MTSESLPRHDLARPVLRVAFTLAWTVGALLTMTVIVGLANAAAQSRDPAECSRLDDEGARLACFDALFPRARERAAAVQAEADSTTRPAAPEAAFGVNDTVLRARGDRVAADAAPESITSPLARLDPLEPGRARLTLANGQVWEQVEASSRFQPRKGETITVRQAALGSFLMSGRSGAAVRARRVR